MGSCTLNTGEYEKLAFFDHYLAYFAWGETCCDWFGTTCSVAWHSGGTLVFDWRTFIVLRSARLQLTGDHLGG